MITERDLSSATGEHSAVRFEVDALDIASGTSAPRILSFLDDERFAQDARDNDHLKALLVTESLQNEFADASFEVIVVPDPRWSFYTLANALVSQRPEPGPSQVHPEAFVSDQAWIAPTGVTIGPGCTIEAFAAVHSGVTLEPGVTVRSGAIVGNIGFEHKRTSRGVVSILHDGGVRVGEGTEIGSLVNIAQGFVRRETIIGRDVRIDSQSHVAHGCHIGDAVFIAAGVTISGSVTLENEVWVGPGAVISNQLTIGARSRVAIGAVVLRDVPQDSRVAGNPARGQL